MNEDDIDIGGIRDGSVIVELSLPPDKAEKLFWLIKRGGLEFADIFDAELISYPRSKIQKELQKDAKLRNKQTDIVEISKETGISISSMPLPVFVFSSEKILDCNESTLVLLGYSREEFLSHDLAYFTHPDDVKSVFGKVKQMVRGDSNRFVMDIRLRKEDSTFIYAKIFAKAIFNDSGSFTEAIVCLDDKSHERDVEIAFQNLNKHYATTYTHSFFQTLVESLSVALNMPYVYIGKYFPNESQLEIIAIWQAESQNQTRFYSLHETPSQKVLSGEPLIYSQGLGADFPHDTWIQDSQIDGYMGIPLFSSSGKVIGLMVIMDTKPIPNVDLCLSMLQIYSSRVASELERRNNEEALVHNEEKYRMLYESSADGIMIIDWNQQKAVECNIRMTKLFKTDRKTILKGNILIYSPEFQSDGQRSLDKVRKIRENANRLQRFEWQFQRPDESLFDAEVIISPFIHKGQYMSVFVLRDISERKLKEKTLKESESLKQSMLKALPDLTLRLDDNGNVLSNYDPGLVSLINKMSATDEKNKEDHLDHIFPSKIAQEILKTLRKAIRTQKVISFDYTSSQEGNELSYEVRINGINDHEAVAVVRDITSLKEAQKHLAYKSRELEEKGQELQKYIESNFQLENFAYIASNELRQPLLTIHNFAKQLEKQFLEYLDEPGKANLNYIIRLTQNMNELIEDLLIYSQVQSQTEGPQSIVMHELMSEVLESLNETILVTNATVEVKEMPTMIYGNRSNLTQLFQNIVSNAIKFHRVGVRPRVVISGKETAESWVFSIKDNGIGMDEKEFDIIFLPFKRLQSRDKYQGTGIGLAICKKIIEQYKGRIWVESSPEEGSTFNFEISKLSSD